MILHVDMDAFYASVEQRDRPELRGLPVIVGGATGSRGVVCAASYEAREYGVHSAMASVRAQKLCPQGIFLPPRMNHYAEISRHVREIFLRYTPLVEPLSLDEAFLDVAGSERLHGDAVTIGRKVQQTILSELGLIASVGVASNKFLAKLASDLEKPNGFVFVDPHQIQAFLDPLPVSRLWGVGKVSQRTFAKLGIRTVAQLRKLDHGTLETVFGPHHGTHLWQLAHGHDQRVVVPDHQAKSISHETTFAEDVQDRDAIRAWLLELADQVGRRLRRESLEGQTVHLKIRYHDFQTLSRAITLPNPTSATDAIYATVRDLYQDRIPSDHPPLRLLGVGLSNFHGRPRQRMLFDEEQQQRQSQTDATVDEIRDRFGNAALTRATRLLHHTQHRPVPGVRDEKPSD